VCSVGLIAIYDYRLGFQQAINLELVLTCYNCRYGLSASHDGRAELIEIFDCRNNRSADTIVGLTLLRAVISPLTVRSIFIIIFSLCSVTPGL
jgi:hypothetical protein